MILKQVPVLGNIMQKWSWLNLNSDNIKNTNDIIVNLADKQFTGVNVSGDINNVLIFAEKAAEVGIKSNYWFWTLINTEKNIRNEHPDWFNISRTGRSSLTDPPYVGYYKWYCPNRQEVHDHLLRRIGSLCQHDILHGIHLDYIRYPDVILPEAIQPDYGLHQTSEEPQFDFCYCNICREKFITQTGTDPIDLKDPAHNRDWLEFRLLSINNLVEKIVQLVHSKGKHISAAVFPHPDLAIKLVRQDWTKWDLDAVFPMIYHNFYYKEVDWIAEIANDLQEKFNYTGSVIPGIYIPKMDEIQFDRAMEIVRSCNLTGISFFEYNSLLKKSFLNKL
jgi:uncharacterized lipoprotein YddW (UPF0748 family)